MVGGLRYASAGHPFDTTTTGETVSNLTVCKQLDDFEETLPPLAASMLRANRALYARTARDVERLGSMASQSFSAFASAATTGFRTITGTARRAADQTASAATSGARRTVGQVKAQTRIAADAASEELEDLADQIDPAAEPVAVAGSLETQTKSVLYDRAQKLDIAGRSSMTKAELVAALQSA